jgi:hypothetical protein
MGVYRAGHTSESSTQGVTLNVPVNARIVLFAIPSDKTGKPVKVSIPPFDDVNRDCSISKVDNAYFGKCLLFFCEPGAKGMPRLGCYGQQ